MGRRIVVIDVVRASGELNALLKRLHLANAFGVWPELVERAEREVWSFRQFLLAVARDTRWPTAGRAASSAASAGPASRN